MSSLKTTEVNQNISEIWMGFEISSYSILSSFATTFVSKI